MLKLLSKSIREYKVDSILAPLFIVCEVICECFLPWLTSQLIDALQTNDIKVMIIMSSILVVVAFASLGFGFASGKHAARAAAGFAKNLRHDLYYKVQDFSFENIDKFSASSLVTRMTTDVGNIQMAYGMMIRGLFRSPLMLIISIIMAFTMNVKIATVLSISVPVLGIVLFLVAKFAMPVFHDVFHKYDALNESVQENINGIRVVKSYVREDYEKKKFGKASDSLSRDFIKAERIVAINTPVMQFVLHATLLVVSCFGAYLVVTNFGGFDENGTPMWGELSTGGLQSLITYSVQSLMAIMMLSMIFVMLSISMAAAERIAEVLREIPTLTNPKNPVMDVKDGSIEFKNVSFKYSEHAEKNALDNVSISIPSGATVGIIGGTGSSKTSFVNLISRLYDVTSGELLVGGVNVKDYDLEVLRDKVSVVLQKNVLFSGTIASNLRWGNENATDDEIKHVCHLACADEFIERFPDKYDTRIDQGGTNVSGGQKQRLCIARALLKNPKILILDDSTSAVDTKTDAIIRKGFKEYIPETTKIIIAQRLSSVEEADMIIVMDNGTINGVGTHEELIKNNAIYREVYEIQNKNSSQENGGNL